MPVYNEREIVAHVVEAWIAELNRHKLDYVLWICDDGSQDNTSAVLKEIANRHFQVCLVHQRNRGHGPTILRGYRLAQSEWVFQADGDGEIGPNHFAAMWEERSGRDVVLGCRVGWRRPWPRRFVSMGTRLAVWLLFGKNVHDPNVPFRLWRRSSLASLLDCIPDDMFAPNVALTGLAVATRLRFIEVPVRPVTWARRRRPLRGIRLWRAAARSLQEIVAVRLRMRDLLD